MQDRNSVSTAWQNTRAKARNLWAALAVVIGAAILASSTIGPAFAASTTSSSRFNIDIIVFVPCAEGGAGEFVELSGSLHDLFQVTDNGKGKFILHFHDNPQGVVGTGLSSGDKYRGTGVTQGIIVVGSGVTETFVNNFRIIGQGADNNYTVHDNSHLRVNPDGTVTSFHDNFSITCK